jgi:hypothetical protein
VIRAVILRAAFLPSLALLAAAAPATADTTLGQLANATRSDCQTGKVYLQAKSATGLSSYTAPSGGVITSWSETPLHGQAQASLIVAAPSSAPGQYTVVAISPEEQISGESTQTFPVRMPMESGDVLGLYLAFGAFSCEFLTPEEKNGDEIELMSGTPKIGWPFVDSEAKFNERLNLTATLEPDADHDGYGDTTQDPCPTDPSTHEACPAPKVSGSAQLGQTLSAVAGGSPENPSFAWMRCAANGEACYPIPGASAFTYAVSAVDIGHTLRFRKSAHNATDTQVTESEATALVPFNLITAIAPRLWLVSQSARRWREGNLLPRLTNLSRSSQGTVFSFDVNLPTTVTMTFLQKKSGRRSGHTCAAPNRHNARHRRCTRIVSAAQLGFPAKAAANRVLFQGLISTTQRLKPGSYTVVVGAGPPALKSASKSLTFTITR